MISVVIITKNEEDRIKTCLESVKWASEIIVLDNGSEDSTLDIVKKYTEKIFNFKDLDFATIRNKGMEKAMGEWVLYVDSDERVLEPLKIEIQSLIETDEQSSPSDKSAYAISRKNIIFGRQVSYGPYKKDWMIRFFKKDDFEGWTGKVHESSHFKGKLGYTKNFLLHLTHRNIDHFLLKSLEWSKIDAKLRMEVGHPKMSGWRFLRILFGEMFNQGIKKGGFFNGTVGVVDSILQTFSLFITYVRLWELQNPKSLDEIYNDIDKKLLENSFNYP